MTLQRAPAAIHSGLKPLRSEHAARRSASPILCVAALSLYACAFSHAQAPTFRNGGPSAAPSETRQESAPATQPFFRNNGAPVSGTDNLRNIPAGAYQEPPTGVPYRAVFRDTGAPYLHALRDADIEPTTRAGNTRGRFDLDLPDPRGSFPLLDRGFEPEDADLKLGPVYFKLRAISAAVLHSDNIRRSNEDRESDTIGILRLSGTVIAQLSEGFRIATSGSFVYLPFEGKSGISGFSLIAPYSLGLSAVPVARTQFVWDTKIGGWDVTFADEFRIGLGRYAQSTRDDFELFEGGGFDESDRAGRYVFRAPRTRRGREGSTRDTTDGDFNYYSNTISAATTRQLPGSVRLSARIAHENLWYNQGRRGLPKLREEGYVRLESTHENLRFKPFLSYHIFRTDLRDWSQSLLLGVNGPITDQLHFHGAVGLFNNGSNGANRLLWDVELRHLAGPYTRQSISYRRGVSDFYDELREHWVYRLQQVLGPELSADAFVSHGTIEDLDGITDERQELRAGVRLAWQPGPKTHIRLSGIYTEIDGNEERHAEVWTGRLELGYHVTDTLLARLVYQHQTRSSNRRQDNYDENLVFFSLTKFLD